MPNTDADEATNEINQFISLIRARFADQESASTQREAEKLWAQAYGCISADGNGLNDLLRNVGIIVHNKLTASSAVALHLAHQLAEARGQTPFEVLDDVERIIAAHIENPST